MKVGEEDLAVVKKVVGMLHTASLLYVLWSHNLAWTFGWQYYGQCGRMDDVEDDSHLRRGLPGSFLHAHLPRPLHWRPTCLWYYTVAHKIYGVPQTINSANYVYFLAYQELQRIHPSKPGTKVEEAVTGGFLIPRDILCELMRKIEMNRGIIEFTSRSRDGFVLAWKSDLSNRAWVYRDGK